MSLNPHCRHLQAVLHPYSHVHQDRSNKSSVLQRMWRQWLGDCVLSQAAWSSRVRPIPTVKACRQKKISFRKLISCGNQPGINSKNLPSCYTHSWPNPPATAFSFEYVNCNITWLLCNPVWTSEDGTLAILKTGSAYLLSSFWSEVRYTWLHSMTSSHRSNWKEK